MAPAPAPPRLEAAALLGADAQAVVSRGGRPDLASRDALATVSAPTLLLVGGWDDGVIDLNQLAYDQLRCEKEPRICRKPAPSGATGCLSAAARKRLQALGGPEKQVQGRRG